MLISGRIGIVDHDEVDASNLSRQVIHKEENVGLNKSRSAAEFVTGLNSTIQTIEHPVLIDSSNALDLIEMYDIIVDATDNVATRYLLNDACVIMKKPLVSGGALRMDGQITVYSYLDGPCYRCIFPIPPPVASVGNCNSSGVLGAVTGVM